MDNNRQEIIKKAVAWLQPINTKKTNIWTRKANKIVRDYLKNVAIPNDEKREKLRNKRKKTHKK